MSAIQPNRVRPLQLAQSAILLAGAPALGFVTTLVAARFLPPDAVALFFLIQALIAIMIEVSGFGLAEHMLREASRDQALFPAYLRRFLRQVMTSGLVIAGLGTTAFNLFYPSNLWLLVLATCLDVSAVRVILFLESAAIARKRAGRADLTRLGMNLVRLVAASCYIWLLAGQGGVELSLAIAFADTLLAAGLLYSERRALAGRVPTLPVRIEWPYYSANMLRALQQNLDRFVVSLVLSPAALAGYVIVARMYQFSIIPTFAVLRRTFPDFVEQFSAGGLPAVVAFARRRFRLFLATGLMGSAVVLVGGLLLPYLVGTSLELTLTIFILAAPATLIAGLTYLVLEVLTASGHQSLRARLALVQLITQAPLQALAGGVAGLAGAAAGLSLSGALALALAAIATGGLISSRTRSR